MIELRGKHNSAKVFTDTIEEGAIGQIIELCNQELCKDSKIRIMPDVHKGSECTIGTTMTIQDKIVPSMVGVDIGCGMETIKLDSMKIDLEKLDSIINKNIPSGFNVNDKQHEFTSKVNIENLRCKGGVDIDRAYSSIGTLGGGNHFIEVDRSEDGELYLVIHSGSRYLGKQVESYYSNKETRGLKEYKLMRDKIIRELRLAGRDKEIQSALDSFRLSRETDMNESAYISGKDMEDYLHDMKITQEFASWNRKAIAHTIIKEMGLSAIEEFSTVHNYIDTDTMILRKGAISAKLGEVVLIPMNMRDGSIIAIGKGNTDWNESAPHGAGRIMSRSKIKKLVSIEEFEDSMKGIMSSSVKLSTIDESPMAYKPMEEILKNIGDTVEIAQIIKPIYNFKAS